MSEIEPAKEIGSIRFFNLNGFLVWVGFPTMDLCWIPILCTRYGIFLGYYTLANNRILSRGVQKNRDLPRPIETRSKSPGTGGSWGNRSGSQFQFMETGGYQSGSWFMGGFVHSDCTDYIIIIYWILISK